MNSIERLETWTNIWFDVQIYANLITMYEKVIHELKMINKNTIFTFHDVI